MTFITTIISDFGIIQASDSNLTAGNSTEVAPGLKVFDLPFAEAALSLAGNYLVGSERMDSWMPSCIKAYSSTIEPNIAGFANYLKMRLEMDLSDSQRLQPSLFHIAGYVLDEFGVHPEFHFVRNCYSIDSATGRYSDIRAYFLVTEDFWTRDYPRSKNLRGSPHQLYFNGTPDGRIAFVKFGEMLFSYLGDVWRQPEWKFRPPTSLQEYSLIVDLEIRVLGSLYAMSDYDARSIGGEPQIVMINPPANSLTLWLE